MSEGASPAGSKPSTPPGDSTQAMGSLLGKLGGTKSASVGDLAAGKANSGGKTAGGKAKWMLAKRKIKAAAIASLAVKEFAKPTGKYLYPGGGKFNMSNPKSDIEWKIHRANEVPGPSQYGAPKLSKPGGGKFNMSKPKTEIELRIYHGKSMPAPGQYIGMTKFNQQSTGKFNMSKPKSDLEWKIHRAKDSPGPGQYFTELCPLQPCGGATFKHRVARDEGVPLTMDPAKRRSGANASKRPARAAAKSTPKPTPAASQRTSKKTGASNASSLRKTQSSLRSENKALRKRLG